MSTPTRLVIQNGSHANDGTGDTLRDASTKINNNFATLWDAMYDSAHLSSLLQAESFNFNGVPISDPSVEGLLWRDSDNGNVLKVSRG